LANSSCGICGKSQLSQIEKHPDFFPEKNFPRFSAAEILGFSGQIMEKQTVFSSTGGLHAAALFDQNGRFLMLREDIGRHNALDKLMGRAVLDRLIPLREHAILVSGRAGFELVQKAAMAGLPLLAAVGAPSSLAVEWATATGMTLVGFLRDGRFNVYSHAERNK
jgi:FdhD protein